MRKLLCPPCKISGLYLKNPQGERLPIYVTDKHEIVPKDPNASLEGFDLTEIFCLGCSWSGTPKRLVKY